MAPAAILMLAPKLTLAAPTISLIPSSTTVKIGEVFQLDVFAKDLDVGAYDVTFQYNPLNASIDQNQVTFDNFLGGPLNSFQSLFAGLDTLELAEVSFLTSPDDLNTLQAGRYFPLAHIQVKPLAAGTLSFDFTPTDFTLISDYVGNPIAGVAYQGASVFVMPPDDNPPPPPPPGGGSEVPEPSGVVLLLSGVGFIAVGRLWRRRAIS